MNKYRRLLKDLPFSKWRKWDVLALSKNYRDFCIVDIEKHFLPILNFFTSESEFIKFIWDNEEWFEDPYTLRFTISNIWGDITIKSNHYFENNKSQKIINDIVWLFKKYWYECKII